MSALESPDLSAFWNRVDTTGACWEWTGSKRGDGYGQFIIDGSPRPAHRYSWEKLVGEIPEGMVLDHLCRNRPCVNPDHLEVVTNRINVLRGYGPTAINATKTHCVKGHEFTPENTRIRPGGWRQCRTCTQAWANEAAYGSQDIWCDPCDKFLKRSGVWSHRRNIHGLPGSPASTEVPAPKATS